MPLKITITNNELHDFIKLDAGIDDAAVNLALETAKLDAEQFLNTDFHTETVNPDGTITINQVEAPLAVKLWVFNRVAQLHANRGVAAKPDFSGLQLFRVYPGV